MVKMAFELLDRKAGLITQLTHDFFEVIILFLEFTAITVIYLFFRDFLQAVAGKMEASIAWITIKYLVRIIIEATETDLTVCLEEFFIINVITLCWSNQLLIFYQSL